MKRIDLHIHTKRTVCDSQNFEFSMNELIAYVKRANLAAIAITNHNCFDLHNYKSVREELRDYCEVFPGIEINVKTPGKYGHVLVIAPNDLVEDFNEACKRIDQMCPESKSSISWDDVCSFITFLDKCLIIPHYRKNKQLDKKTIEEIRSKSGVDALEVSNNKIWLRETGGTTEPLVVFSDARPGFKPINDSNESSGARFAYGFTYIDISEVSIQSIKLALTKADATSIVSMDHEFEILPEGIAASNKLNVLLGERSSGKTFTLERIIDALEESDYWYIEQFDISEKAKKSNFDKNVREEDESFFSSYFAGLERLLGSYLEIDLDSIEQGVKDYTRALMIYAGSPPDDASKTPIYKSEPFKTEADEKSLKDDFELRKAVRKLASDTRRREQIERHLSVDSLTSLDDDLRLITKSTFQDLKLKGRANQTIALIQNALSSLSARKPLPDTKPIRDYFRYCHQEALLANELERLSNPESLESEDEGKYLKTRKRLGYTQAGQIPKPISKKLANGDTMAPILKMSSFQDRLQAFRNFKESSRPYIIKNLFQIQTSIVLNDEKQPELSGGQRAEYCLLHELSKARGKDLVLIDEPESSFDNPFLSEEVCKMIKAVAQHSTVFLVTHNNSLGVSIHPDWILYTEKRKDGSYAIYSGAFTDSQLRAIDGAQISRPETLINILEAGEPKYLDRRKYYGID